jgi:UDP-glucose:glycoprotein glucosyltransferase
LARAKRLIPEWTVYDKEIAALASRIAAENKSKLASSDTVGLKREDSADAFVDEAGQLEQAREQQKEFVQEGTGAEADAASEAESLEEVKQSGHIAGEL